MHPFMPIPEPADTGVPLHIGQDNGRREAYLWWLQTQQSQTAPVRNDCGCVDVDLTLNFEIV